jgi:hypothetical protein
MRSPHVLALELKVWPDTDGYHVVTTGGPRPATKPADSCLLVDDFGEQCAPSSTADSAHVLPTLGWSGYGCGVVRLWIGGWVVGLFSRKKSGPVWVGSGVTDGDLETEVVGESFYRKDIIKYLNSLPRLRWPSGRCVEVFRLVAEPDNPHDANAVRVDTQAGVTVGYLPREIAPEWSAFVQRQSDVVECGGAFMWNSTLGQPRPSNDVPVGVRLDLVDQR